MTITYRINKGSTLTYAELDGNFSDIEERLESPDLVRDGFITYSNSSATPVAITGGSTWYQLDNDGAGDDSLDTYAPEGITQLWDITTDELDFSELSLGDQYLLAMYVTITTTAANQEMEFRIRLGIGSGGERSLIISHLQFKTSGTRTMQITFPLYIAASTTITNPARLEVNSDGDGSVLLEDLYIRVAVRGGV